MAVRAAKLGGQQCGVVVVIGVSGPSWVGSGRVEERCNVLVPATLGPRAESDRLPTSAIPRASVSDLRADARQPHRCRDKPAV